MSSEAFSILQVIHVWYLISAGNFSEHYSSGILDAPHSAWSSMFFNHCHSDQPVAPATFNILLQLLPGDRRLEFSVFPGIYRRRDKPLYKPLLMD
jgi:hypothetical protein